MEQNKTVRYIYLQHVHARYSFLYKVLYQLVLQEMLCLLSAISLKLRTVLRIGLSHLQTLCEHRNGRCNINKTALTDGKL